MEWWVRAGGYYSPFRWYWMYLRTLVGEENKLDWLHDDTSELRAGVLVVLRDDKVAIIALYDGGRGERRAGVVVIPVHFK